MYRFAILDQKETSIVCGGTFPSDYFSEENVRKRERERAARTAQQGVPPVAPAAGQAPHQAPMPIAPQLFQAGVHPVQHPASF